MKKKYTQFEIEQEARRLDEEFKDACTTYKLALSTRDSNRSKKELCRGNTRGTSIHKFQCAFAWIMHDLITGPIHFAPRPIEEAEELIAHIRHISNT